jgi:predicted nucleotidyltransferase
MPGATLLDLGGLQADLEDILGIPVDVLTPDDIPLKFRTQVLLEAEAL